LLGIIIVNYKSEKETVNYINTELSKITSPNKIVIVNNSSSIESNRFFIKELRTFPAKNNNIDKKFNIFLLSPNENLGFAKANNLGATFLMNHFNIEYLLFTNSDIVFSDNDVVESLISKAVTDDKIGGIGPRVAGKNDIFQSPHEEISFYRYFGWYLLKPLKGNVSLLRKNTSEKTQRNFQTAHYCYWVSGCFMIVKAEVFFNAGMFDSKTFLYSEEKILAERFLRIGKKFYFEPHTGVIHKQGATTSKHLKELEIKEMIFKNDCYYYKTYRGIPDYLIWTLRLIRKFRQKIKREN